MHVFKTKICRVIKSKKNCNMCPLQRDLYVFLESEMSRTVSMFFLSVEGFYFEGVKATRV